ncbi:MAG: SUMF1/EgtB/PvdO family nonheme iron enzyme [Capsulimonadaceae bacterium]
MHDDSASIPALAPDRTELPPHEVDRLTANISDPAASTKERVVAGRRLAEIGDPRPGVGLRPDGLPDIAWRDVPGGEFIYGGDNPFPPSFEDRPRRTIWVDAFRIAKDPVTYRQFQAFVDGKRPPGRHRDDT